MKKFIQITVLAASVAVAAVQAQALVSRCIPQIFLSAELETINIHPNHSGGLEVIGGNIQVDMGQSQLRLTLFQHSSCPPGMFCAAYAPAPKVVELPIVKTRINRCGDVIYTALEDKRPADGALEKLVVVDHTQNHCPVALSGLYAATGITYSTTPARFSGDEVQTSVSTFTAGPLEREPNHGMRCR